jgi:AcrR family transcriptional regulator
MILERSFEMFCRDGMDAVNARSVAKELGGSTQPIFRLFSGMEELKLAVTEMTLLAWKERLRARLQTSAFPYLSIGMSFLLFARDEPELFKLLFMRDRVSDGSCTDYNVDWGIPLIENSVKVDVDTARKLYQRNWLFCYGLAVSIATKYIPCISECEMRQLLVESLQGAATQLNVKLPTIDQCNDI